MKKVLIANRGEIAVRIARACADYGVRSVAVYADADIDALHVRRADEAFALNGEHAADTYLSIDKLLGAARRSGADAVHPGYGFLSESSAFAQAVIDAGLTWIGPSPAAIALLGDKVQARKLALRVGAPLVAGTAEPVADAGEVLAFAARHGLPITIKAAFGGGGRGIKIVRHLDDAVELYDSAVREAIAAFGRGECFLEQYLDSPRHIEAQVIADTHGRVVVLGTRDCSLQRRNQKLVEEAPAPFLGEAQRARLHDAARKICAAASYTGAGTVEFLLSRDGTLSFLEVNTRLQVEHPVTEETSGIDLVVEQLRIADGLPLSVDEAPPTRGHCFEFRINAEDVGRGFLPTSGRVDVFEAPSGPGVRVDSGVVAGSSVPRAFDSLMAKLIVTGATRQQAIARARRALREFRIEGVPTVLPFHRAVMAHPDFCSEQSFDVHTRWIDTVYANDQAAGARPIPEPAEGLRRTGIEIDGRRVVLGLPASLLAGLSVFGAAAAAKTETAASGTGAPLEDAPLLAPVSGTLQAWKVSDGEAVAAGAIVAVMEAMKMEIQVTAHRPGRLRRRVEPGQIVTMGDAIGRVD